MNGENVVETVGERERERGRSGVDDSDSVEWIITLSYGTKTR